MVFVGTRSSKSRGWRATHTFGRLMSGRCAALSPARSGRALPLPARQRGSGTWLLLCNSGGRANGRLWRPRAGGRERTESRWSLCLGDKTTTKVGSTTRLSTSVLCSTKSSAGTCLWTAYKGKPAKLSVRKKLWTQSRKAAAKMLLDQRKARLKSLSKHEVCARARQARSDKLRAAKQAGRVAQRRVTLS